MKPGFQIPSDSESESAFMPMVDALFVILSIFFVAFIVLSKPNKPDPDFTTRPPISLLADQYFEIDSFQLSDEKRQNLRNILSELLLDEYNSLVNANQIDKLKFIIIAGHADKQRRLPRFYTGITANNQEIDGNEELSYFRAFTVYREVTAIFDSLPSFNGENIDFSQLLMVAGVGSRSLKCKTLTDCETNGDLAFDDSPPRRNSNDIPQNRRIEIHFIFDKLSEEDNAE